MSSGTRVRLAEYIVYRVFGGAEGAGRNKWDVLILRRLTGIRIRMKPAPTSKVGTCSRSQRSASAVQIRERGRRTPTLWLRPRAGSRLVRLRVWSRRAVYGGAGHEWNDELTKLVSEYGVDYTRRNFRFAFLEYRPMKAVDVGMVGSNRRASSSISRHKTPYTITAAPQTP